MIEIIAYALMAVGTACTLIGGIGLLRFPDVYNRLHANTVLVVGGVITLIIGGAVFAHSWILSVKALVIAGFLFLTNPVGAHAIARAAYRSGVKLWKGSVADELKGEGK